MESKMVRLSDGKQYILNPIKDTKEKIKVIVFELADGGLLGNFQMSGGLQPSRPIREYSFETAEDANEWMKVFEDGSDTSLLKKTS